MASIQGMLPIVLNDGLLPTRDLRRDPLRGVPLPVPAVPGSSCQGQGTPDLLTSGSTDLALRREGAIAGVVTRIRYANLEKGYYVLGVRLEEGKSAVSFVGPSEAVAVGDRVEAQGTWERHAKYGRQLRARFIRVLVPSTGREILEFLKSGAVKGVGKRSAEKLFDTFGDNLVKVMDRPTLLMTSGISEKQADLIATAWSSRSNQTELLAFLQSLSIGPATAGKIIKKYGERARQVVVANPYRIVREISGIGFKTADQMALAIGIARTDSRRIDAAILHCMGQIGRDGHCACTRPRLMKDVRDLLILDDTLIRAGILRLMDDRLLIEEDLGGSAVIYDANVLKCEEEIAERIALRIGAMPLPDGVDEMIAIAASAIGIDEFHEHQALAVRTSLGSRFSVITGGPGAGKTSSLEVLLRVFEAINPQATIALSAPTGRAAQRMSESTGRPAMTIHRTLEWSPEAGGFTVNEKAQLDVDLLVLDETSMLDIWLARDVLRALKDETIVVFVGDVDQLPSVGAGRVLGDIIDSGTVPVTRLTRIFRQGAGSLIAQTAQAINHGRLPALGRPSRANDMWALYHDEPEDCLSMVCRLATEIAPKMAFDPMRDVQILVAGHGGTLGTVALNQMMQEALNPENANRPGIAVGERYLRPGDRVIQMANNYDLDVFNGDIGQVLDIAPSQRKKDSAMIRVVYDDHVVDYDMTSAKDLSLAYAISVHKSQGSEFPFVIFVASTQHFVMLRKTLVYTAITRARQVCAIVGQERAMKIAVRQSDGGRVTGLARRLAIARAEAERRGFAPVA